MVSSLVCIGCMVVDLWIHLNPKDLCNVFKESSLCRISENVNGHKLVIHNEDITVQNSMVLISTFSSGSLAALSSY